LIFASKRKKPILPETKKLLLHPLLPRALHKLLHVLSSINVSHVWLALRNVLLTTWFGELVAREDAVVQCNSWLIGVFSFFALSKNAGDRLSGCFRMTQFIKEY